MKTKDRNSKIIFIGFVITIFLFICVLVNQWIEIKETGKVDKQVQTSFVSTENVNTSGEIQEKNTTLDTSSNQTEESILTTYKGYPVIAKLEIPKINLETYVISEYSNQALGVSVTKFYGGNPNEVGNFCIAGHNYNDDRFFGKIDELELKDKIALYDLQGEKYEYIVFDIFETDENDTSVLENTKNYELTLVTCNNSNKKRVIVKAYRKEF